MSFSFFYRLSLLLFLCSCVCRSQEYRDFYAHLHKPRAHLLRMEPCDYFLVILVDARHLDYTQASKFLHSVAKHPNGGSKHGDVGHAWIYLQGKRNGKRIVIEGGHSGEIENPPARYFDGLMNYHDWGYSNPTPEQIRLPRYEPNPIKYLQTGRKDGFFQKGSGGHRPTYAAKIPLTRQQFEQILQFIHPRNYAYQEYALTGPQCSTFAVQVAKIAGLSLSSDATMRIAPRVFFGRSCIRLWEDPYYATLTFPTPDILEKSLMQAVEYGKAEEALDWYLKQIERKTR